MFDSIIFKICLKNTRMSDSGNCIAWTICFIFVVLSLVIFSFVTIDFEIFQYVNITRDFVCVNAKTDLEHQPITFGNYMPNYKDRYVDSDMECVSDRDRNCLKIPEDKYLSLKKRQENYYIYMICITIWIVSCIFTKIIITLKCVFQEKMGSKIYKSIIYVSMFVTTILFIVLYIVDFQLCELKNLYVSTLNNSDERCTMFCSSFQTTIRPRSFGLSYCSNPINNGTIPFIIITVMFSFNMFYYFINILFVKGISIYE